MVMRFHGAALLVSLALVGAAPAAAQRGDHPGPSLVIATNDGREVRIPLSDISNLRISRRNGADVRLSGSDIAGARVEGGGGGGRPDEAYWGGRVWEVDEGGWKGVWTRKGDSDRFRAVWRNKDGQEQRDELILESVRGDKVVFFRESKRGRYRITLSPDRTRITHGTADWYRSGDTFNGYVRDTD